MRNTVKKTVAILLVAVMSALLCSAAFASDLENQTFKVTFDVQAKHMFVNIIERDVIADDGEILVTSEATETYVKEGESVEFYISHDEGYSTVRVIVDAEGEVLKPDVHGVYTIEDVTDNMLVHVYLDADTQSSNFLSALLFFFRQLVQWFRDSFKAFVG